MFFRHDGWSFVSIYTFLSCEGWVALVLYHFTNHWMFYFFLWTPMNCKISQSQLWWVIIHPFTNVHLNLDYILIWESSDPYIGKCMKYESFQLFKLLCSFLFEENNILLGWLVFLCIWLHCAHQSYCLSKCTTSSLSLLVKHQWGVPFWKHFWSQKHELNERHYSEKWAIPVSRIQCRAKDDPALFEMAFLCSSSAGRLFSSFILTLKLTKRYKTFSQFLHFLPCIINVTNQIFVL